MLAAIVTVSKLAEFNSIEKYEPCKMLYHVIEFNFDLLRLSFSFSFVFCFFVQLFLIKMGKIIMIFVYDVDGNRYEYFLCNLNIDG